jgi:hypothetical protein
MVTWRDVGDCPSFSQWGKEEGKGIRKGGENWERGRVGEE